MGKLINIVEARGCCQKIVVGCSRDRAVAVEDVGKRLRGIRRENRVAVIYSRIIWSDTCHVLAIEGTAGCNKFVRIAVVDHLSCGQHNKLCTGVWTGNDQSSIGCFQSCWYHVDGCLSHRNGIGLSTRDCKARCHCHS